MAAFQRTKNFSALQTCFDGAVVALDTPVGTVQVFEVAESDLHALFFRGSYAA